MEKKINIYLILFILGILIDIFVLKIHSDLLVLILTGLWILTIRSNKLGTRASLFCGLTSLLICVFLLMFQGRLLADKLASWTYIFLTVGTIQTLLAYRKENNESNLK